MTEIGATHIISAFDAIAGVMETNRDALCALDGEIGDADHGIGMALGFGAIRTALATLEAAATPTDVFNTAAKSFLNAVGASTGPLYATAFMRAAAAVKGKNVLETEDISVVLTAMADGIAHPRKSWRLSLRPNRTLASNPRSRIGLRNVATRVSVRFAR